jgi:phage gp29-like protein
VRDMLGLAEPDDDAELLTPPAAPIKMTDQNDDQNDSQVPELQASTTSTTCTPRLPRDPVELLAGMAETVAQPGTDAMIDTIRRMINEAKSLDEVRDNIVKLSPHMPEADLAVLMRLALVMAELSGRNEIGAVP